MNLKKSPQHGKNKVFYDKSPWWNYFYLFEKFKTFKYRYENNEICYKNRGVCCRRCNCLMQEKQFGPLPIYFHNSMGFDNHLLLKHFPATAKGRLSGIPSTEEKFKALNYTGIVTLSYDIKFRILVNLTFYGMLTCQRTYGTIHIIW